MRAQLCKADAGGAFRALGSGTGFRIAPTLPGAADGAFSPANVPGQLPVRVRPDGSNEDLHYPTSDVLFQREAFGFLEVAGAEPNGWYLVQTFDVTEGMVPASERPRRATRLAAAGTSVPTVAPTLVTDGFPVRPGTQNWTVYATAGVVCRLWVRSLSGNWRDTGVDLDFFNEPVQTRFVDAPADRFALVAASAGMTVEIDSSVEVG